MNKVDEIRKFHGTIYHVVMPDPACDYCVILDALSAAEKELKEAREAVFNAFVEGAKWWDYHKTGATMWQFDQQKAECAALSRYPFKGPFVDKLEAELSALREKVERIYPCVNCGVMRTKDEGGTVFTVCDDCWDKLHKYQILKGEK